jgi:hypothetical protein
VLKGSLALLGALAGRALACKPVPFRRRTACSPNSLLHPRRTSCTACGGPCRTLSAF